MKTKKHLVALLTLALAAFAAHADTHLNELMFAAWDGNTAEVRWYVMRKRMACVLI